MLQLNYCFFHMSLPSSPQNCKLRRQGSCSRLFVSLQCLTQHFTQQIVPGDWTVDIPTLLVTSLICPHQNLSKEHKDPPQPQFGIWPHVPCDFLRLTTMTSISLKCLCILYSLQLALLEQHFAPL